MIIKGYRKVALIFFMFALFWQLRYDIIMKLIEKEDIFSGIHNSRLYYGQT